jgi:hypothetical protein
MNYERLMGEAWQSVIMEMGGHVRDLRDCEEED